MSTSVSHAKRKKKRSQRMNKFAYMPKPIEYGKGMDHDEISKRMSENQEQLEECDRQARENDQIVGRYITHPFADGQAVYQIIRDNKRSVRIRVCIGLGDDWVLPAWGYEYTLDKEQALQFLGFQDSMRELSTKKFGV